MNIKYKEDICWGCNLPKLITQKSLHLCTSCNNKRLSKSYRERLKKRIKEGKITDKQRLSRFFKKYWSKYKEHVCFESGEKLYYYSSWHLHHLIEKGPHPELAYKEDNIVYLTLQYHSLWHSSTDEQKKKLMPKTYKRYLEIKLKYNAG